MIIIQDKLISDDVIEEFFLCNLSACKGACCWEGDYGAPLEKEEMEVLSKIYPIIRSLLGSESIKEIDVNGPIAYFEELKGYGTSLLKNGACAFMLFDAGGVAKCGIEKAFELGLSGFRKPISCHLYPVRVVEYEDSGFIALNYDKWEICSSACEEGKKIQLPVYQFLRAALERKFGSDFYDELDAAAKWKKDQKL